MSKPHKTALFTGLVCFVMLFMGSAQAAMISTSEALTETNRAELHNVLERNDVQQGLIEMGVDPAAAMERVNSMTDEEIAQIHGQLDILPAGAGIGTTDLLLIIIILILLL